MSRSARKASLRTLCVLALCLPFADCGGGGGGSTSSGAVTPSSLQSTGTVTFTVTIPAAQTASIRSINFRLTGVAPEHNLHYGGALDTDTLVLVTIGSFNCVQAANGDNTCTATAVVPAPATDRFTVYTYGTANPVVGTTVPLSIYVGYALGVTVAGPNNAMVATNGVPASLAFSPAEVDNVPAATPLTGATALTTSLQVTDASGATLIGTSDFASSSGAIGPVQMTGCDAHLTPTPATIDAATPAALGPGTISVAYDGQLTSGTVHCYGTGPGGLAAQYTVNIAATNAGGGIVIIIPAAQPVVCTPSPVSVGVAQRIVIACNSQGYSGPIAFSVADPTIAAVQLAAGTYTLFYVSGLKAGTTTATFQTQSGGSGQVTITVTP